MMRMDWIAGVARGMVKKVHSLNSLPKSIGRRTALEVYETLRGSVMSGRILPGTYISQVDVARDLGVSRTPVREALRRLQENGLVAAEPNFRVRVLGLEPEEVEALYIKRILLESFAAGCTARSASAGQLADIRSALNHMNAGAAKESASSRTAARLRLYHALSAGAPTPLGRELHSMRERCRHYEEPSVRAQASSMRQRESEAFRDAVGAIARSDAGRASRTTAALLTAQALEVLHHISPSFDPSRLQMAATLATTHTSQSPLAAELPDIPATDKVGGLSWIDPLESGYLAAPKASTPGARGRPSDPNKREAILKAARQLFLTYGPSAVTMSRLAETANVAKATVYACYEDKNAVIVAMVRRESELVMPDNWQDEHNHAALAAMLTDFGQAFLGFMVNPQLQSLERLISGLASREAELGDRLFFAGPGRAMNVLRAILSKARTQGHITTDSIDEAAEDLLGLWQGFLRIEVNFHQLPDPKASYLRQRAARGVRQFLKLYAPKD